MKHFITGRNLQVTFVLLSLFSTLLYAFTTNHVWEDFYITFKHSKNLVDGNGLVYHPGEKVHGFTSVINTLLPALFYWITGKSLVLTIWLYRIASIAALIFGGLIFLREIQRQYSQNLLIPLFFTLFFAFQIKTIMFTTNGQEAGFMMLFLLPTIILAYNGFERNWKWLGLCWAGLIYTRPDGVAYILITTVAVILARQSYSKKELFAIFKAGSLCAIIYLPWFIGVWLYYGTPVPHTITAKSGIGGINFTNDLVFSFEKIIGNLPHVGKQISLPTYYHFGAWPYWIKVYGFCSWLLCSIYWLIPSPDKFGRFISLTYTFVILYLSFLQTIGLVYPWYFPPAEMLAAFILCSAIYHIANHFTKNSKIPVYIASTLMLYIFSNVYFMSLNQIKVQQEVIETNHRKEIGLWLNKNKQDNDTVFLEPLGYIGFYSNATMLDWPGLVAPKVVAAEQNKKAGHFSNLILKLKPSWVVIRPYVQMQLRQLQSFNESYELVKVFNALNELKPYANLPGINYLYYDSVFYIYKQKKAISPS